MSFKFTNYKKEELVKILNELAKEESVALKIQVLIEEIDNTLLKEYEDRMEELFFPMYGMPVSSLKITDELVKEYHEKSNDHSMKFDMHYLEMLLEYLRTYGMMSKSFYDNMTQILKRIVESPEGKAFYSRLETVADTMGYIDEDTKTNMTQILKNLE